MRLRAGVRLEETMLVDAATGLRLALGTDAVHLLATIGATRAADGESEEVGAFFRQLRDLGLFEPASIPEARVAQGRWVLLRSQDAEAERIRATVEHAVATTRLHEHLRPNLEAPDWTLEDLPLLRKHDVRRHFPAGLTPRDLQLGELLRSGDVVVASTSGTTGERLQTYSDTRIPRLPPDFLRFWQLGKTASDRPVRTAVLTSPNCSGTTCSSQRARAERLSFEHTLFLPSTPNPFRMTDKEVLVVLEEMDDFGADFWLVNPVYLVALADKASALGRRLPAVEAILTTYQFLSHCQRRAFARHFEVPVFPVYSATELGGSQVGVGCPHGRLHVRLDQVFLEIVREGVPVPPGEVGLVTVTTHNPTMPLVRYALGDLARFDMAPCSCEVGSSWPSLVLEGRERDAFACRDRLVSTRDVDEALRNAALAAYQLTETVAGTYLLEVIPEASGTWRGAAEDALGELLRPEKLVVEEVTELPMDASQKFRFTRPLPRPRDCT